MHSVLLTAIFLRQWERLRASEDELMDIVSTLAHDPHSGDLMAGTGGARKLRHARPGSGKSGGFRTIHYFGGDDIPVFLLAIYAKGTKNNLTKAERNELASLLPLIGQAYRRRR
jgi:hypothetical protein